jgi:endonuclease G, mitochondrial
LSELRLLTRLFEILGDGYMWNTLTAANTILKNEKLLKEFYGTSKSLNWGQFGVPKGEKSADEVKDILTKIVNLRKYSPLNLNEELVDVIEQLGNPAILVKSGKAETSSEYWAKLLTTELQAALPAVGRIRLLYTKNVFLGTAWFVEGSIAVTAGHVAKHFVTQNGDSYIFPKNDQGKQTGADMNTRAELEAQSELIFRVKRVIYIDPVLDIAFLEMEGNEQLPSPISLEETLPSEDESAAVIGHPRRFEGYTNAGLAKKVYGDVYEVKRVLMGEFKAPISSYVTHSCPTLGGCSGAPLINIKTGKAVGLHVGGDYNKVNLAIPAHAIAKLLNEVRDT